MPKQTKKADARGKRAPAKSRPGKRTAPRGVAKRTSTVKHRFWVVMSSNADGANERPERAFVLEHEAFTHAAWLADSAVFAGVRVFWVSPFVPEVRS